MVAGLHGGIHVLLLVDRNVIQSRLWQHQLSGVVVVEPVVPLDQPVGGHFEEILDPPPDDAVDPDIKRESVWLTHSKITFMYLLR